MTLVLHRISRGSVHRLISAFERNPNAQPREREVEGILLDGVGASHLYERGSAVLLADANGSVVGAALHYSDAAFPGSQYIAAVLIDHRFRHHGYGRELLVAVIGDALMRSGGQYVNWVVDPMNDVMLRLSREVGMNSVRTRMDTFSSFIRDAAGNRLVRLAA